MLPRATVAITTGNVRPSLQTHTQSITSDIAMKVGLTLFSFVNFHNLPYPT